MLFPRRLIATLALVGVLCCGATLAACRGPSDAPTGASPSLAQPGTSSAAPRLSPSFEIPPPVN